MASRRNCLKPGFFSESYSGGTVAERMCQAGIDAVIIQGAAPDQVWIEVSDQGVHFHSSRDLWGLDTFSTEDHIKDWIRRHRPRAGRCGVPCIGVAGENRIAFAVVENDYWRSAGRTGVGAVMGSKNIKGIAFWSSRKVASRTKLR